MQSIFAALCTAIGVFFCAAPDASEDRRRGPVDGLRPDPPSGKQ